MDKKTNIKLVDPGESPGDDDPSPAPAPHSRVARYEELEGAEGRAVFFRPQRYAASDLAPLQGLLTVTMDGEVKACPVLDVSQNGAAISWPRGTPPRKGKWLA